jgi:hypothetical protein
MAISARRLNMRLQGCLQGCVPTAQINQGTAASGMDDFQAVQNRFIRRCREWQGAWYTAYRPRQAAGYASMICTPRQKATRPATRAAAGFGCA